MRPHVSLHPFLPAQGISKKGQWRVSHETPSRGLGVGLRRVQRTRSAWKAASCNMSGSSGAARRDEFERFARNVGVWTHAHPQGY
jgi:hypothetical protein